MTDKDGLQRFLFEHANIRGEIVHLNQTFDTIIHQHPYPDAIKILLGEAMLACVLLTGSLKFEGEVSLQFQGDSRLSLLLVQCDHKLQIRALAQYQAQVADIDYQDAFKEGKMVLNLTPFNQTQTYQSIVPIQSGSMAENLMYYFAQSEQLACHVTLAVEGNSAAGMLLQLMPGQDTSKREEFWSYAVHIGQTITNHELLTLDNETILHRLYHETDIRLFDSRPIQFKCRCNVDKMKQALTLLGQADVYALLEEHGGKVTVNCDFCNQHYAFDAIDVALFFREANSKHPNR